MLSIFLLIPLSLMLFVVATYHLGRLTSYALLGLIAGLIGITALAPFMQGNNMPRILLGLVLVFVGVTMLGAPILTKLERFGMRFWQYLSPLRQKVFPLNTFPRALTAGLLWGFLPCGLVYGALLIAVVAHNPLSGAALMFIFGLGTIPMLVATHETVGWLRDNIGRLRLRQLNGAVMVLSGLAVAVVPMVMTNMHGGHSGDHAQMDHSNHAAMMSETNNHDMNQRNHDMQNMDTDMDHSTHDMSDGAASMQHTQ